MGKINLKCLLGHDWCEKREVEFEDSLQICTSWNECVRCGKKRNYAYYIYDKVGQRWVRTSKQLI